MEPSRTARRKARTRQALVRAAQQLLADGRTAVSIQEITETADVGFGTFYNHFDGKQELFEAATLDALQQQGDLVRTATADLEDPAEVFCVGLRLTGRLVRASPEMARIALQAGTRYLVADEGLAHFARRDVEAAVAAGRFDVEVPLGLVTAGGALLGLIALLVAEPDLDAAALSDQLAERLLRALGLPAEEATALARRPLPAL